jgi:O-acetyl-ADP-ribose deacetylase
MPARLSLSDIPTISRIYGLETRTRPCQPPIHPASARLNEIVSHITYDITCLEVDCIVNAANEFLHGGSGVDGAIHSAAGPSLLEECDGLNGCATGDAKITEAYRLPCKKVIHAVGPKYYMRGSISEKEDLLRSCYRRSLELAAENGLRSIAFSSLSTGIYGYPNYDAANTAIDEVRKYLTKDINQEKLDRVIFCTFVQKDRDAYEELLPFVGPVDIPSRTCFCYFCSLLLTDTFQSVFPSY